MILKSRHFLALLVAIIATTTISSSLPRSSLWERYDRYVGGYGEKHVSKDSRTDEFVTRQSEESNQPSPSPDPNCGEETDSCSEDDDPPCCANLFCNETCQKCREENEDCGGPGDVRCCQNLYCRSGKCQKCGKEGNNCGTDFPPCCTGTPKELQCVTERCRACSEEGFECGINSPQCCTGLICNPSDLCEKLEEPEGGDNGPEGEDPDLIEL